MAVTAYFRNAGLTLSNNVLYGTTAGSGPNGGTVFAMNIAPATIALSSNLNATIITGGTGAAWHDGEQFPEFCI